MGKLFDSIDDTPKAWIEAQPMWFVATAPLGADGHINVSPHGISDSCGWGVPVMEMTGERDLLRLQAEKKGPEGMSEYRAEKNTRSIDGLPGFAA